MSLASGVWLSGIQIVESAEGLRVVFPTSLLVNTAGSPLIAEMVEFDSRDTRIKWEQRILAAYGEEAAAPQRGPEPKPKPKPAPPPAPLKRETTAEMAPKVDATVLHVAGGCRGNPGTGAAAALVCVPGREPIELMNALGESTPSLAEHTAILMALREVERLRTTGLKIRAVVVRGDSAVAIKHLQGQWSVTDPALKELAHTCLELVAQQRLEVVWEHVSPADNAAAAALVQRCLDAG